MAARSWLLVLVLVVGAGVSAAVARAAATSPAPRSDANAETPLLSARRTPSALRTAIGTARLSSQLDRLFAAPDLGGAADTTCLRVEDAGRVLYDRNGDLPLLPASNLKILTAAAVLNHIGPEATLKTQIVGPHPGTDGTVSGDVWVVGGGDPLLSTGEYAATFRNQPQIFTPIEKLADSIVAAGVRRVTGSVIGDESRFDQQRYVPSWKAAYITDNEIGPMSALAVNDGFAQFTPRRVAASSPATHAATVLTGLLAARGVAVDGAPQAGPAPPGAGELAFIDSQPVRRIVVEMLQESDNFTAELLIKELGKRASGQGSTAAGTTAMLNLLEKDGLATGAVVAVDGSGLDRSDRATCAVLTQAIERSGPNGPIAEGFPVAGSSGTLARRFLNSPAAGRLRAKTGSLDGVAALTGFVDRTGGSLGFALVANRLPDASERGRRLQGDVGAALARYPDAPSKDELGPRS